VRDSHLTSSASFLHRLACHCVHNTSLLTLAYCVMRIGSRKGLRRRRKKVEKKARRSDRKPLSYRPVYCRPVDSVITVKQVCTCKSVLGALQLQLFILLLSIGGNVDYIISSAPQFTACNDDDTEGGTAYTECKINMASRCSSQVTVHATTLHVRAM